MIVQIIWDVRISGGQIIRAYFDSDCCVQDRFVMVQDQNIWPLFCETSFVFVKILRNFVKGWFEVFRKP